MFVRRGTAGARTQEIAKEAGVNPALLHYYFRTKERLAEAVFQRAAGQLLPAVIRILGSDAALEDKVEQVVRGRAAAPRPRRRTCPATSSASWRITPTARAQLIAAVTGEVPVELGTRVCDGAAAADRRARPQAGRCTRFRPISSSSTCSRSACFPFAARPMLMALLGIDQAGFDQFIDRRRKELAPFFLRALRP